jgi:hypothetical protein
MIRVHPTWSAHVSGIWHHGEDIGSRLQSLRCTRACYRCRRESGGSCNMYGQPEGSCLEVSPWGHVTVTGRIAGEIMSRLRKEGQQLDNAPHSVTTWAWPHLLLVPGAPHWIRPRITRLRVGL